MLAAKVLASQAAVLLVIAYAFMLMVLGPRRAPRVAAGAARAVGGTSARVLWYLLRLLLRTAVNTTALLLRIAAHPTHQGVTDAWAAYLERMADALLG